MEPTVAYLSTLPEAEIETGVSFLHQNSVRETFKPHTHSFFEFFYVLRGKAIHHINHEKQVLSRGHLVFVRPTDMHYYSFIDQYDMELLSIGVAPDLVERCCTYLKILPEVYLKHTVPPQIFLQGQDRWDMEQTLLRIEKTELGMERQRYFLSVLPDMLYKMLYDRTSAGKALPKWLANLLDEMERKENYVAGLGRMIELSGVTQEHLNRSFKKYVGMTPTAYINLKRINLSADMLASAEGRNVLEICYECGFNHVNYFYQQFEKAFHCTPGMFMKNSPQKPVRPEFNAIQKDAG